MQRSHSTVEVCRGKLGREQSAALVAHVLRGQFPAAPGAHPVPKVPFRAPRRLAQPIFGDSHLPGCAGSHRHRYVAGSIERKVVSSMYRRQWLSRADPKCPFHWRRCCFPPGLAGGERGCPRRLEGVAVLWPGKPFGELRSTGNCRFRPFDAGEFALRATNATQ